MSVFGVFWSVFSCIRIEYREIRSISPYSVRMWENVTRKSPNTDTFHAVKCKYSEIISVIIDMKQILTGRLFQIPLIKPTLQRQPPEVFCKKRAACNFIKKETLAQVFCCEFREISKNIFFTEHVWATASYSIYVNFEKTRRTTYWYPYFDRLFKTY